MYVRTFQGLKRKSDGEEPEAKRKKHGCSSANLQIDKQGLMNEAKTWEDGQSINWSQLGTKYGLDQPNRGQVIKEFLAEQGITAAQTTERSSRAPRR
jgi:Ni/Co efflux regulator RcnB